MDVGFIEGVVLRPWLDGVLSNILSLELNSEDLVVSFKLYGLNLRAYGLITGN